MRLLDLFCGGGAAMGYADAGYDVYGVDLVARPNYPFAFHQGDALDVLRRLIAGDAVEFTRPGGSKVSLTLNDFDAIHASPPCQAYSVSRSLHTNDYPRLVEPVRALLIETGLAYVIENVPGSDVRPDLRLCGTHFELGTVDRYDLKVELRRHRLFESNVPLPSPGACRHGWWGRTASVFGTGGGWDFARASGDNKRGGYKPDFETCERLMGLEGRGLSRREVSEAIPPSYAAYVGRILIGRSR